MEFLSGYVLNIIAVGLILTFGDILLPEGNLKKYGQMALSICMLAVIISPLLKPAITDGIAGSGVSFTVQTDNNAVFSYFKENAETKIMRDIGARVNITNVGSVISAYVESCRDRAECEQYLQKVYNITNITWNE